MGSSSAGLSSLGVEGGQQTGEDLIFRIPQRFGRARSPALTSWISPRPRPSPSAPHCPPPKSTSSRQGPPTPALLLGNYVMGWTRRSVAPLFSTESPEAWSVVGASADTQDPQLRPSASCVRLRPDFPGIPDRGFVPAQASQGTAWPPTVSRTVTDKYRDGQVQALRVEGPARAHTASLGEPAGERGGRPQRAPLGLAVHRPVTRGTRF